MASRLRCEERCGGVADGVAVRAMDGGASRMGFLLPSFSRRDNLVKYDKRMISPQHTRHVEACRVLCTTQQSTTLKKRVEITRVLNKIMSYVKG